MKQADDKIKKSTNADVRKSLKIRGTQKNRWILMVRIQTPNIWNEIHK